jgi:hypothetical protein
MHGKGGMNKTDVASGIILMLLSLVMLLEARKLDVGSLNLPREGLLPFILAILLFILSSVLVGKSLKSKSERASSGKEPGSWNLKRAGSVAGLLSMAFFFERLGYAVSAFGFLVFLLGVIEKQKWWLVFIVAFLTTLCSYLMLGSLLDSPLPKGILRW